MPAPTTVERPKLSPEERKKARDAHRVRRAARAVVFQQRMADRRKHFRSVHAELKKTLEVSNG